MHNSNLRAPFTVAILLLIMTPALAKDFTVTVTARNRDYRDTPVRALIIAPRDCAGVALMLKDVPVPVQSRKSGNKVEVVWIVKELKKGDSLRYRLTFDRVSRPVPVSGVIIDKNGANLDIRINNELFATYNTTTGPNKPYFYPMFSPGQKHITRGFPIEHLPDDASKDHPHHRGMWFTHGEVNGQDYWSEEPKSAKTVNKQFDEVQSGPVCGFFRASTDWITHDGAKAAEDVREVTIYDVPEARLVDFKVTVKATNGALEFQDTKEGTFGLRVPDSMRVDKGAGHIEMSTGIKGKDAWGKRAEWVDYYGPAEGVIVGVAILDSPSNFRHPTYWHVRDYGLFCANPFGLHDFIPGQPKDAGNMKVEAGKSATFAYRIFIHKGSTSEARVADVWGAYSDPPVVEVK